MAGLYELLGVLLSSFLLNLIPFAGPSNLLIASNAALLVDSDPLTIGFLVALGSASAKLIHYVVTFFIGGYVGEERRRRLNETGATVRRWALVTLFIVATTPLPDEPVVIPLGLLKYNPVKFFSAYFAGKLLIGVVGAYLGIAGHEALAPMISQDAMIVISIGLTVVFTIILLKVDVEKIAERILKRKVAPAESSTVSG